MPYRNTPFVTNQIYHVFNRSIASQTVFIDKYDYKRVLDLINFYRFSKPPLRFSHYKRLSKTQKEEFEKAFMINRSPMIEILAFCIMPNHVHFLLKPKEKNAVSNFMRNLQNSYSKYFNTKRERTGSLFQFMFKAVRMETDEQLVHVSRYIHLNPATAYIVDTEDLDKYEWSSFKSYISDTQSNVSSEMILSRFKSKQDYKKFVFDQLEYQRELAKIKHLIFD
ncbi:MAG: transposase [Candidatus Levybacteria bacterium]|nr:transposase [Candidatus Levybacteria bacterium]